MKTVSVFGRLLLSVSERLKSLAELLGRMATGEGGTQGQPTTKGKETLIWEVIEGPYHREAFDEDELLSIGVDDNLGCFLVVKLQEDGEVGVVNFWVETEEEAYEIVKHFKYNIEPLEVSP